MLTPYDIQVMQSDVREIINMWGEKLVIYKPKPIAEQQYWNEILSEFSGAIEYDLYNNVVSERKDIQNMRDYDLEISTQGGDSDTASLVFTCPDVYTFIDESCRILYEGDMWRIKIIKHRIGEKLFVVNKFVGTNEKWANVPANTYDMGDQYNV